MLVWEEPVCTCPEPVPQQGYAKDTMQSLTGVLLRGSAVRMQAQRSFPRTTQSLKKKRREGA